MFKKLLASLPATILATTALAQPIYFTANEFRAVPAATAETKRDAAEYPADLGQPIYATANAIRTASPVATVGNATQYPSYAGQPIYFIANKLRAANVDGTAAALGAQARVAAD